MATDLNLYISLVWLFVFMFAVLMLFLCYLFLSMRRSLEGERISFEFSLLAVETLEAERRRVARELHDTVLPLVRDNQELSGLLHRISAELQPPDFRRVSLKDSLADLCVRFTRRTNIECACFMEDEVDFSPFSADNALHLYRIVQESFTNIEKHSQASKASLIVRRLPRPQSENILVCVSDDGKGLNGSSVEDLGMKGMRQRAAILGATLDFVGESGHGLMVRVEIPPLTMSVPT